LEFPGQNRNQWISSRGMNGKTWGGILTKGERKKGDHVKGGELANYKGKLGEAGGKRSAVWKGSKKKNGRTLKMGGRGMGPTKQRAPGRLLGGQRGCVLVHAVIKEKKGAGLREVLASLSRGKVRGLEDGEKRGT